MIIYGRLYFSSLFSHLVYPDCENAFDNIQDLEDSGFAWCGMADTIQYRIAKNWPILESKMEMVSHDEIDKKNLVISRYISRFDWNKSKETLVLSPVSDHTASPS